MPRTLTPDALDLTAMRSLVVVKPSSLGDIVHTLPAVALIKRAHPQLSIRWVVRTEFMALLDGNPDLDGLIEFPRREMRGPLGVIKLFGWARRTLRSPAAPDLLIDFQGLARSAVMAKRSGAREVIGLSDSREGARFFHRWIVPVDAGGHAVDRYLEVPRALGIDCSGAADLFRLPDCPLPDGGRQIPDSGRFVLLHPFSRGAGKSLSVEQVRKLCLALAPLPVVLVGQSDEQPGEIREGVIDLLNRTSLGELVAITRRAGFVISVDSGPMHIAAALSDQLLSIHTWSDPRKVGPYAPGAWVWKGGEIQRVGEYVPGDGDPSAAQLDPEEIADLAKRHCQC